jgi:hypothetical protein
MGFALWIDGDVAWAEGTHEYRPMGAAVVAVTDRFRSRDFRSGRRCPARGEPCFVGLFGSLEELNEYLWANRNGARRPTPPWL